MGVGCPVVLYRREDAQRDRDHHGRQDRKRRQQQGRRELGDEGVEHVLAGDVAHPHVAGEHTAQPGKVLGQKGLVQPQLGALGVDDLLRDR